MRRRFCSRRFIGGRHPGWLPSDPLPSPPTVAAPKPQPRFRRLLRWTWAGLVVSAGITLAVLLARPVTRDSVPRQVHRFPSNQTTPPLDQLLWWNSFSEVEQTKAVLRGLALQSIAQIRGNYLRSRTSPDSPTTEPANPASDPAVSLAIQRVRSRLEEFHGTEQTTMFHGELFRLLRKAGLHGEWLDHFLELLYRQPDNPIIPGEITHATQAARATNRETELRAAIDHWNRIPPRFRANPAASPEPNPGSNPAP